jgi:hypothetical protein
MGQELSLMPSGHLNPIFADLGRGHLKPLIQADPWLGCRKCSELLIQGDASRPAAGAGGNLLEVQFEMEALGQMKANSGKGLISQPLEVIQQAILSEDRRTGRHEALAADHGAGKGGLLEQ